MNGQEFATAVQYDLPIVVVLIDNGIYGTIRMHQERDFPGRVVASDLRNPDFAAYARAFGGHGETVEETAQFLPAFERALASGYARSSTSRSTRRRSRRPRRSPPFAPPRWPSAGGRKARAVCRASETGAGVANCGAEWRDGARPAKASPPRKRGSKVQPRTSPGQAAPPTRTAAGSDGYDCGRSRGPSAPTIHSALCFA